ncbi:MAG: coenzyme F420-reducing hydrogenase beta subunit [Bacillariaceae sp.]|jgi:coenzyme F420-reducing hydrogenase beta subunit
MKAIPNKMVRYLLLLLISSCALVSLSFLSALLTSPITTSSSFYNEGFPLGATRTRSIKNKERPIDPLDWPDRFPAKEHCSKCGLCETSFVTEVKDACAFLGPSMARIDDMEEWVHGRKRNASNITWSSSSSSSSLLSNDDDSSSEADEARFGVLHEPIWLAQGNRIENAQWTGVVTGICLAMLESNQVDAVVCIASNSNTTGSNNFASPEPILARTTEDVLRGRGVKPALAPSLRVLDEIQNDPSIRRLLFCGVGCAVQAFRAIQSDLDLDEVYVIGTNCADNSPTSEAARNFILDGVQIDQDSMDKVQGYEFMQDFQVHVKTTDSYITKPYFTLPGTIAEASIAKSCRKCFDYTNGLADIVVGYMGAPLVEKEGRKKGATRMDESLQTLTIRNKRGAKMAEIAQKASRLTIKGKAVGKGSHEKLASATVASDAIVMAMVGKSVPEKGMPKILGQIMAFGMTRLGPKGINFARYSIDYHILRNYLYTLKVEEGNQERAKMKLPQNAMDIVDYYQENDAEFANLVSKIQGKI